MEKYMNREKPKAGAKRLGLRSKEGTFRAQTRFHILPNRRWSLAVSGAFLT